MLSLLLMRHTTGRNNSHISMRINPLTLENLDRVPSSAISEKKRSLWLEDLNSRFRIMLTVSLMVQGKHYILRHVKARNYML